MRVAMVIAALAMLLPDGFHLIQLAMTRDLKHWVRLGNREPFIKKVTTKRQKQETG